MISRFRKWFIVSESSTKVLCIIIAVLIAFRHLVYGLTANNTDLICVFLSYFAFLNITDGIKARAIAK